MKSKFHTLIPDYIDKSKINEDFFRQSLACNDLWRQDYLMAKIFSTSSYANLLTLELHTSIETTKLKEQNEDTLRDVIRYREDLEGNYSEELEELAEFMMDGASEEAQIQFMLVCHVNGVCDKIHNEKFQELLHLHQEALIEVKHYRQQDLISAGFCKSPKLCTLAKEELIHWILIYYGVNSFEDLQDLKSLEGKGKYVNFVDCLRL